MYKYRRFNSTISGNRWVSDSYIKDFITKQPVGGLQKLHPRARTVYNRMIQEPKPLTYKLHEIEEKTYDPEVPLGNTSVLPFQVLRTHTNNLPVYSDYKHDRSRKSTIVRLISGDVNVRVKNLYRNLKMSFRKLFQMLLLK
jgi:hypothetical protein